MRNEGDSRFPSSECKNIEGVYFYGNFKIPKRQFVRGGNNKNADSKLQAAHAIFEAPEGSSTTVYLT
jgi:hypothetical protein